MVEQKQRKGETKVVKEYRKQFRCPPVLRSDLGTWKMNNIVTGAGKITSTVPDRRTKVALRWDWLMGKTATIVRNVSYRIRVARPNKRQGRLTSHSSRRACPALGTQPAVLGHSSPILWRNLATSSSLGNSPADFCQLCG